MKYVQYIVVNRGLKMSRGKLMAQASHASMAFLAQVVRDGFSGCEDDLVDISFSMSTDVFSEWLCGAFGKIVLAVDSEDELIAVIDRASACGLVEDEDLFVIRDHCLTELTPDETGTRMTAIGFVPKPRDEMKPVVGDLPLFC